MPPSSVFEGLAFIVGNEIFAAEAWKSTRMAFGQGMVSPGCAEGFCSWRIVNDTGLFDCSKAPLHG
jgi:hypothetical protein